MKKHVPGARSAEARRRRESLKAKALESLGASKCACCGSTTNLHIDHIEPQMTGQRSQGSDMTYRAVIKNPEGFQLLCAECNRWKADGPACPCKYWDAVKPGWRLRRPVKFLLRAGADTYVLCRKDGGEFIVKE